MIRTKHAGYYSEHPVDFQAHLYSGHDEWIIVNTLCEAEILIDDIWTYMPPYQVLFFPPYVEGNYRALPGKPYVNHWVSFYTDEKYILNSSIPSATPIQVSAQDILSYIFHMIATENCFNNEFRSQSIDNLFHLLFYKINEYMSSEHTSLRGELNKIRFEMQSNPSFDWSVPYIAKQLNISVGYLQNIYKKTFGISCMNDIFEQRIALAKNYITQSSYSITEVAEICGYKNVEHFCRQFKKLTGMTPSEFRASKMSSS